MLLPGAKGISCSGTSMGPRAVLLPGTEGAIEHDSVAIPTTSHTDVAEHLGWLSPPSSAFSR